MHKVLRYAAIAGILYLIVSIPSVILEVLRVLNQLEEGLMPLYISLLLMSLILFVIFVWGFKVIGEKYQNNLLKVAAYILIIIATIFHGYSVLALIFPPFDNVFVQTLSLVLFGAVMIPLGIGLLRLKTHFGSIATAAGVMEIISGISFLTVLLSFIGILLVIPVYILSVIILFRAAKKLETSPAI